MTQFLTDETLESTLLDKRFIDILTHASVSDLNTAHEMIEVRLADLILGESRMRADVLPEQHEATSDDVIKEVSAYSKGINAVTLGNKMVAKGYQLSSVQKAIQRALDKGQIELGSRFRLQIRTAA